MYATIDDMIDRFGVEEIEALAPSKDGNGEVNTKEVEVALLDASDVINSYLAGKYALPLSIVPSQLKRICCLLARYNLYKSVKPDDIEKDYENSIYYLKDVAKGIVVFEHSATGAKPKQSDEVVFSGSARRDFSSSQMKGF